MTPTDLLIIYLAFGAPLAVYKYLQKRHTSSRERIFISAFTFVFWIPSAVRIGYLYFANAYFGDAFVSQPNLDSIDGRRASARESIRAELIRANGGLNVHEVRETVERYAGLAAAVGTEATHHAAPHQLFKAAGRQPSDLAGMCLSRRNRRRLEQHHTSARREFLALFTFSGSGPVRSAIEAGIVLARELGDDVAVGQLSGLMHERDAVWNKQEHSTLAISSPAAR